MWIREGAAGFLCLELDQFADQLFISPPEYPESVLSAHDLGDIYGDDWATPFEAFFPRTPLFHPSIHPSIIHQNRMRKKFFCTAGLLKCNLQLMPASFGSERTTLIILYSGSGGFKVRIEMSGYMRQRGKFCH